MKLGLVFCFLIGAALGREWFENGNFYQIYPRSFRDSNGDGIGDLNGITEKLQYLKDLGISGAWLSPIFKSPMRDFGYDISDYYAVHPEYGTMEDFEKLIKKAKEVGVKIILDFVPNHTSDKSEWFKKSINEEGMYKNFYVWHNGIPDEDHPNGARPPSNWLSAFRYSAWTWNDQRQQYYLHQFGDFQPDLNYRDDNVVNEMKNVIRYWLGKGVSGFRIDAVPFMFEVEKDPSGNYPNEQPSNNPNCPDPDDYCYLTHSLTNDQPETYDMIYQWRELVEEFKNENGGDSIVLLTEAYTSLDNIIRFYGDGHRKGSHVPFNFDLMSLNKDSTAAEFSSHIDLWLNKMPKDVYANWVLGNHDNKRLASRMGVEKTDLYNILLQTLPGNAVTYNGEELGLTDVHISWEDTVDPQACNADKDKYETYSRDTARTPFPWDASSYAGFTPGSQTWLPVAKDFQHNNVLMQERSPQSHLQIFKKLLKLRKEPSLQDGTLDKKVISGKNILVYKREKPGSDIYLVVLNFGSTNETINLKEQFPSIGTQLEVITTSVQSTLIDGDVIPSNSVTVNGYAGTVFVSV